MFQLSRDLEAEGRQGIPRQDIWARVEAYLGLQEVLFDEKRGCEQAVSLSSPQPSEEERLLADQEIFIVGEE